LWDRLLLIPLGPVDGGVLEELGCLFSRRTPLMVEWGMNIPLDEGEGQVQARGLLERLPGREATVILGVTAADLSSPGRLYVFGQGALGYGMAVVSYYRLLYAHHGWSPCRELLLERLYKVALHEVGHALGLSHCVGGCVMGVYPSVYQLDRAAGNFCEGCRTRLGWPPGQHSSTGQA